MRLLVVTAFYPPHHSGGYEMRCRNVVEGLIKRGHAVLVITTRCPDPQCELHSKEENLHRVLHQKIEASTVIGQIDHDRKDLWFIDQKVKEFNPDIIYLWHIQNLSNAILPYFSGQPIPLVYDEGGSGLIYSARILKRGIYFYDNANDSVLKKILKNTIYWLAKLVSFNLIKPHWTWPQNMRVYFNSYSSLQNSRTLGAPVESAGVIHSGIEIAKFPFNPRERIGLPVKIMMPGRVKAEKGTKDSIYLAKALMKRSIKVKISLIGEIQSQEYFNEIFETINENGLYDVIEYMPMVSQNELACFYQESDICFFSTYFKSGLSRVPLEAMASGCLVVTYGNEGSKEIVQDKETGFTVPEGDVISVANVIQDLIGKPDQYREILQKARLQIEQNHSMDEYVEKIERYLIESFAEST